LFKDSVPVVRAMFEPDASSAIVVLENISHFNAIDPAMIAALA
jgi:hypothetical protein